MSAPLPLMAGDLFPQGHPCFANQPVRPSRRCRCHGARVVCVAEPSPVGFTYRPCGCAEQKGDVCSRCGRPWDWNLLAGHHDQTLEST